MDELLKDFLVETSESLDTVDTQLVRLEQEPQNQDVLRSIFRLMHSVKGTCGFLGLPRLEALTHAAEGLMGRFRDGTVVTTEAVSLILQSVDRIKLILANLAETAAEPSGTDCDLIDQLKTFAASDQPPDMARLEPAAPEPLPPPTPAAESPANLDADADGQGRKGDDAASGQVTLRVNVSTLERLLAIVSELVLTRNQLLEIARQKQDHIFNVPLQRLSYVTAELQECVMQTRMQPIGHAWNKLPRLVRDLAVELRKDIALVMTGAETELDRQVLDLVKDPLTHLVRNAADHGIEPIEDRIMAGKPARGTISLSAYHAGGTITVEITDDGRGIDYERIRAKARFLGLANDADLERMSDAQLAKLIFSPGFTTAERVTAISGRGVGLDVVQSNIEAVGGTIDVRSAPGRGTTFTLRLPLTLAILPALLIGVRDQRYALPQSAVMELVRIGPGSEARVEKLDGSNVLSLRGQLLPLATLAQVLGFDTGLAVPERGFVVVVSAGSRRFAVVVDTVFHTEEIVVKPMSTQLRQLTAFSGNTILGDGTVVLIIEPTGLARLIGIAEDEERQAAVEPTAGPAREVDGDLLSLLLFRAGARTGAVPLSAVTRLEEIETARIEDAGGQTVVQYRERLMPVRAFDEVDAARLQTRPCLVITYGEHAVGLLVDEIIDVVEVTLAIDTSIARIGTVGSAIVSGRTVEVVDVVHFLRATAAQLGHDRSAGVDAGPGRVLLVENSAFFRDMLVPLLKARGYKVMTANDADAGLALIAEGGGWHAIVADADLPGMDGVTFLREARLRDRIGGARMVLLAVSNGNTAIDGDAADAVVSKFDRDGLLSALAADTRQREAA